MNRLAPRHVWKLYLGILVFFFALFDAQTLTPTENYLYERTYLEPVTLETPSAKQLQSVTYFDGLGRPKQIINIGLSPTGKDLVVPIEYDAYGRQVKSHLPLPQSSSTGGAFYPTVSSTLGTALYGDVVLYSEKRLENSPLNRVLERATPGSAYALGTGKTQKLNYEAALLSDQVRRFQTTTSWVEGATHTVLKTVSLSSTQPTSYYSDGQLYKTKTTDEDGNISYEFKNSFDQVVLTRRMEGSSAHDTYYVYNEYDQLAFVLSPLLSEAIKPLGAGATVAQSLLDTLGTQYRYDGRGRLVEKKLPEKGWDYQVYDQADRLTLYQDAAMRQDGLWRFTKYDSFSRLLYSGLIPGGGRSVEQAALNLRASNDEVPSPTAFTHSGQSVYYTNTAYPILSTAPESRLLRVQYYDVYPTGSPARPTVIINSSQPTLSDQPTTYSSNGYTTSRSTKSLVTATYLNTVEGDLEWNKTYFYYDTLARLIATHRYHSDGGYTKSEALLNFNGDPSLSYTRHKKSPTEAEMVLKDRYLYDTKARLTHHYHTVNSLAEELLSFTQYDQVGRMKQKAVGGSLSAPLQTLNYAYHIRGSLKALNDPSNLGSDLFGYRLYFEDPAPSTGAAAKYNGSISQMDWATKAQSPSVLRRYSFSYDGLDRLLGAYYLKPGASDTATGAYNELLSYDKNGNIKTLSRYGGKDSTPARKTDALTYTYSGGKLTKVVNAISDPLGYPPGGAALGYNSSGELISHPDKGLSLIEYNSMGLPSSFTKGALTTTYRYLADGVRLEKIQGQKRSLRLGDFHYETTSGGLTLQFVPTSEGYYDFIKNAYIYNYVDHLGNIRVSYYKNSAGALLVLEENHYYPFGQKHEGYGSATTATPSYQYKFGSKELQDTGFYDFGARFYMPDIGRWMSVDPLAEATPNVSPYAYALNNPIRYVDPTGMIAEDCPKCPKPSYEGQTMTGADGKNYGAARQQGDNAWDVPTKPLEWLGQTDIEGVTITGKATAPAAPVEIGQTSSGYRWPLQSPKVEMMSSMWDVVGILFANSDFDNKYVAGAAAVGAIALTRGRAADDVLKAESNLWKVGAYSELKGTQVGLNAHHLGQSALMKKMVEGYSHNSAPSILVPEVGHIFKGPFGRVSTNTSGLTTPRQVLSRDIMELRRVYGPQGIPNSSLQQLIQMNKTMYPGAFAK